jgi:probable dihydroxyacetone kinase regulator
MSDSNITRLALANSLKGLMAKTSFNKISVKDIVDDCGLTRQAFYYHFKDKYDLMNWIYYTETARFMSSYNKVEHWMDGLTDLCNYMRQNKTFYIKALNTTGQNSFQEYLHDYIRDISISVIENIKNTEFEEERWGFIAEFISTAFVGLIVRWANNGMKDDPAEYITKMRSIFDGSILSELESQSKKISMENPTEPESIP